MNSTKRNPKFGIAIGSKSDWPIMVYAAKMLEKLEIDYNTAVVSAHRTTEWLYHYGLSSFGKYNIIIAGAGGAAHLPGMLASLTRVPVLGVPIDEVAARNMAEMPCGIPLATFGVGKTGAINAAVFAVQILGMYDSNIDTIIQNYRRELKEKVLNEQLP